MGVYVFGLCKHRAQHRLIVLHVKFLCPEEFVYMINAEPEMLVLIQTVKVCFLFLAKWQQNVFHAVSLLLKNFFNHDVSEFIETITLQ